MPGTKLVFLSLILVLTGCQSGQTSLRMNRDHLIPYPELQTLPQQWEPDDGSS